MSAPEAGSVEATDRTFSAGPTPVHPVPVQAPEPHAAEAGPAAPVRSALLVRRLPRGLSLALAAAGLLPPLGGWALVQAWNAPVPVVLGVGAGIWFVVLLLGLRWMRRRLHPLALLAAQGAPAPGQDEVEGALREIQSLRAQQQIGERALEASRRVLEQRVQERTEALALERDRAEAASQAKTRFLANMSHELRTPLNAVIGAAQLLEVQSAGGQPDPAHRAQLTRTIRASGQGLLGVINDILDLSRIEAGAFRLAQEPFDLVACIEEAVETLAIRARDKGLELACEIAPELAAARTGDALHLRQVLINVLGNAVKFTARGEVVLRARPATVPGEAGVVIEVRDTGVGIEPVAHGRIFDAFGQADETTTRAFGGTGLGLTISREVLRAMGGRITVDSEAGKGACFTIEVDLPCESEPAYRSPTVPVQAAVFEPHGPSCAGLCAQLQRLSIPVQTLHSALDALTWAQALDARVRGVLLVRLDGAGEEGVVQSIITAVRQSRRHTQVLGLIGRSDSAARAWSGSGVAQVLLKPVASSLLHELLVAQPVPHAEDVPTMPLPVVRYDRLPAMPEIPRELLSRLSAEIRASGLPPPRLPEADAPAAAVSRVLLVEDDPVNQLIASTMLTEAGLQVLPAATGRAALDSLARERIDVVLMDWQMPDMDGLEATRRIRSGEAGDGVRDVPIIALTANAFSEDRQACLDAGMNDFLSKPILRDALLARVQAWTLSAERAQPPQAAPPARHGD